MYTILSYTFPPDGAHNIKIWQSNISVVPSIKMNQFSKVIGEGDKVTVSVKAGDSYFKLVVVHLKTRFVYIITYLPIYFVVLFFITGHRWIKDTSRQEENVG